MRPIRGTGEMCIMGNSSFTDECPGCGSRNTLTAIAAVFVMSTGAVIRSSICRDCEREWQP